MAEKLPRRQFPVFPKGIPPYWSFGEIAQAKKDYDRGKPVSAEGQIIEPADAPPRSKVGRKTKLTPETLATIAADLAMNPKRSRAAHARKHALSPRTLGVAIRKIQ
jgi:hypothetical protein